MRKKRIRWRKLDNSAKIFPIISNKKFSTVFRVSAILKEKIDREILQKAVEYVSDRQIAFKVKLRKGFFWYYLEENTKKPKIEKENNYPCKYIDRNMNNGYLFKVTYFDKKINLDVFHSLTDGNTAIKFLQEIIYAYIDIKGKKEIVKDIEKRELSNNTEDSYLKNYNKKRAKREKSRKAYILRGKKLPLYAISVVHQFINLEEVKNIASQSKATVTQYLTAVLAYCIYKENLKKYKSKKPIKICIPVDLKKYFNSNTATNFFSYITIEINVSNKSNYTFEEILDIVVKEFKFKLTQEKVEETMASNVKIGNNFFVKIIPLYLKKFTVNLSYIEIRKYTTTTLSNLGKVNVKEGYKQYIENFLFLLAPEKVEKTKCSIISFENNLVFTFTSILQDKKISNAFFDFLSERGVKIHIEGNGV